MDNKKDILESNGVKFTPVSFGELIIDLPNMNFKIKKEKNSRYIDTIIQDEQEINVGDKFNFTIPSRDGDLDLNYKTNVIIQDKTDEKRFSLLESIMNNATIFALPLIFKNKSTSSIIQYTTSKNNKVGTGYLINAYIDSSFIEKSSNYSLFLLLKYTKTERYKQQESLFKENPHFIKNIDIDYNYVVYEFCIPKEFRVDFDLLIEGEYSKLSKKGKDKIISFHEKSIEGALTNTVLNRDPALVKQYEEELDVDMTGNELHSKFNESDILTKNML